MTPRAVRKADAILGHLRQVMACELIVAAQAYEMRGVTAPCKVAGVAYRAVRRVVEPLDDDRATIEDLERATELIASARFTEAPPT